MMKLEVHKVYGYKEDGTPADCYGQVRQFTKTPDENYYSRFYIWGVYGYNSAGHEVWIADYALQNDANAFVADLKAASSSIISTLIK